MPKPSETGTTNDCLPPRQVGCPPSIPTTTSLPSPQLLAPRFPSLFALAESHRLAGESAKPKSPGLFDALVGDPRVLYYELMEDPSRFEEETATLVQQMVSGQKQYENLSSAERTMLDRATLDWARSRHQKPTTPPGSSKPRAPAQPEAVRHLTRADAIADPSVELEYREDGQHVPIQHTSSALDIPKPPTNWWRKG